MASSVPQYQGGIFHGTLVLEIKQEGFESLNLGELAFFPLFATTQMIDITSSMQSIQIVTVGSASAWILRIGESVAPVS